MTAETREHAAQTQERTAVLLLTQTSGDADQHVSPFVVQGLMRGCRKMERGLEESRHGKDEQDVQSNKSIGLARATLLMTLAPTTCIMTRRPTGRYKLPHSGSSRGHASEIQREYYKQ